MSTEIKLNNFKEIYERAFHYQGIKHGILKWQMPQDNDGIELVDDGFICKYSGYSRGDWTETDHISFDELLMTEDDFRKHCDKLKIKMVEDSERQKLLELDRQKKEEMKLYERLKDKYSKTK